MAERDHDGDDRDDLVETIVRERREFLAGLAATAGGLVAGCSGDSTADPTDTEEPTATDTTAPTPTDTAMDPDTATATDTDTPTDTQTETATETPASQEPPRPDPAAYEASPAVPPQEALDTFKTAPGYEIELVASEPLIRSPVDIAWDDRGRMWVVEMPDYMSFAPGDGKGDRTPGSWGDWGEATNEQAGEAGWGDSGPEEEPYGRIVVLEDPDDDGEMEEATVFLEDLVMPRSIAFVGGGVLVGLPGELKYYQYNDETLELTRRETVDGEYASSGSPGDNPEHTDNGLMRGLDNWLYNAKSDRRFRWNGGLFEENTHFRGQWGIAKDDYGRLYYTTNSNWLFGDLVPGQYLLRGGSNGSHGIETSLNSDNEIYTVRENYGANRAYRGGYHRSDGRMRTNTAVSGPGIYRGSLLPFRGSAFVPDPSGNAIAQFDIEGSDDTLDVDVEHTLYDDEEWGQREFLGSTNEVFRPVYTKTGPDGALYVVDMYKGIFQHVRFLSDYLAEYIIENDLHKVPPSGRIYRIVPEDEDVNTPPNLAERSPPELASALSHSNGWVRDTAQRRFVEEGLTEGASTVREVARTAGRPLPRVHALWALHGMDEIDAQSVFAAMDTGHPRVQQAAIRTGEQLLGTEDASDYVDRVISLGTAEDQSQRVVVQAAYSLGEVSESGLQSQAETALTDIDDMYGDDQFVADAVASAPD